MSKRDLLVVFLSAGLLAPGAASGARTDLDASWDRGLKLTSEDGRFELKAGGRVMNDWAWFVQDDEHEAQYGTWEDGTEFRRIRLFVSGTVHDYVVFKAQYEFAGAGTEGREVAVRDMYVGVTEIPVAGTIRVGHQYEPFGLEENTSSKYITFMERSILTTFVPSRQSGIRQHNAYAGEAVTVAVGFFRDTDAGGRGTANGVYSVTARVTGIPWEDEASSGLVHLGAAYSHRNPPGEVEYQSKPSAHLAGGALVGTGPMAADAVNAFGGEGAVVYGPFSAQAEYMLSALDAPAVGDPLFMGYYAYASVFLTGESRPYKRSTGLFTRVAPRRNFRDDGGGSGAWEVGVRYSFLDLNDEMVFGGELTDVTVGVNWYLNPNTRVMFNYVHAKTTDVGDPAMDFGAANVFETRVQIDF